MLTCDNSLLGGINRHILAITQAIDGIAGCETAVCTTFPAGELNAALAQAGVRSYALGMPHGHALRILPRFRRVLDDFRPDVVHAHSMSLMVRLCLGIFRRDIPVVRTRHGIPDFRGGVAKKTLRDWLDELVDRTFPGKPRQEIFISRGVAADNGRPDATVAYNPVRFDPAAAAPRTNALRTLLGLAADTPVVGTACRVAPQKKPHEFVRVMCEVLKAVPPGHAVVCGTARDPDYMRPLLRLVDEAGVGDRFHWLGYRADAAKLTAELDCFVTTSATEGMPTALLEAMAAKTPIAFMRGKGGLVDLDELNRDEGPFAAVVDADDVPGMARDVVWLLGHPDEARARAERAFAVGARHFDVGAVAAQLVAVYRGMARGQA